MDTNGHSLKGYIAGFAMFIQHFAPHRLYKYGWDMHKFYLCNKSIVLGRVGGRHFDPSVYGCVPIACDARLYDSWGTLLILKKPAQFWRMADGRPMLASIGP